VRPVGISGFTMSTDGFPPGAGQIETLVLRFTDRPVSGHSLIFENDERAAHNVCVT
jgi:hypothetical protein